MTITTHAPTYGCCVPPGGARDSGGALSKGVALRLVCFCLSLILVSAACGAELDLSGKIAPLARPLVDDGEVVGLVIGIVKDGQTQVLAFGEKTLKAGDKPDADTVYEIGSVTKALTGVLLADMIERKLVQLDDPVQKYLPDGVTMPIKDDKPITLKHLSTHTSGLPRLPSNFKPAEPKNPYADYGTEQMYDFLKTHKLRRPPGEHEYSNYGVGLLGQLLAGKAGTDYETLLAERITKPLGMNDTHIVLTDGMRKRLAPPYNAALEPEHNWDFTTFAGAGGVRSTTNDMLKLVRACLTKDDTPLRRALKASYVKQFTMKNGQAMGLGWFIARDGITRWHGGMTGGYSSWLAVVPEHGIGTVVLSNTATSRVAELGGQVTQVAFGLDVKPRPKRKEIEVDPAVLASYAGKYTLVPTFVLTVTVEDGKLMVQATGQPKFPMFAETKTKFFYKVVDAQITFVADADGQVEKLILHQNGRDMEAVREEAPTKKP